MDEPEDIYGDDIYGGASEAFGDVPSPQRPDDAAEPEAAAEGSAAAAASAATAPASARELKLQRQLQQANAELDAWRKALIGDAASSAAAASPAAAAAALQKARDDVAAAHAQAQTATQRASGLEFALSEKNLENVQLRRSLHAARQAADPSIVQVRQLLLDPAVNREFAALRAEVEAKGREVKALQQELQAVNFSQDSKTGRMLMAKCRTLQDENEEMGRELAEGKVHELERRAALAKGFGDDLRRAYASLEDHTHTLDRENEDLQGQVFLLRRQMRELEAAAEAAPSPHSSGHRAPPPPVDAPGGGYDSRYPPGGMSRKRPAPGLRDMRESGFQRDGGFADQRGRIR